MVQTCFAKKNFTFKQIFLIMKQGIITTNDVLINRGVFIRSILFSAGAFVLRNYNMAATGIAPNDILVRMIYNNSGSASGYRKEWGLAIWIEKDEKAVLFDTGGNPETFWKNFQAAGIDLSKLSAIVISHNHWDHTRGIQVMMDKITTQTDLYVPASDIPEIKNPGPLVTIKPVSAAQEITDFLWSTGELKGSLGINMVFEQSVIIIQTNKVFLFTGCAHPGIIEIVERTRALHPGKNINLAAGGFHLIDKSAEQVQKISDTLKLLDVKAIAPSHCTGDKAIELLRSEWKEQFLEFNIGDVLNI